MDYLAALNKRISRRHFTKDPLLPIQISSLQKVIDDCNEKGGLHIQMIIGRGEPFSVSKSHGMFSGVNNYIALVGPDDDPFCAEKLGYYGELIILHAVSLGLGTCWVAGTYDPELVTADIADGEIMKCCIVLGNVRQNLSARESLIIKAVKRESKEVKDMLYAEKQPPNWVVAGMRAVVKAPSSRNRQSTKFMYASDAVTARIEMKNDSDPYDLGIAKLHFEVGAGLGKGTWKFGNGGIYERRADAV